MYRITSEHDERSMYLHCISSMPCYSPTLNVVYYNSRIINVWQRLCHTAIITKLLISLRFQRFFRIA